MPSDAPAEVLNRPGVARRAGDTVDIGSFPVLYVAIRVRGWRGNEDSLVPGRRPYKFRKAGLRLLLTGVPSSTKKLPAGGGDTMSLNLGITVP